MKNYKSSLLCLCLSLLLLLSLPAGSFADTPAKEGDGLSWSISESGDFLFCGEERYLPLDLSPDYLYLSDFSKEGTVIWGDKELNVAVSLDDPDLCVLYEEDTDITDGSCKNFYYKESGISKAHEILKGKYTQYKLNDAFYISDIETDFIGEILSRLNAEGQSVEVSELDDFDQYELLGYHKKGLPTKRIGVFLKDAQDCYYVSYEGLTNSHFTADGTLSTREGEVTALVLTSEEAQVLEKALEDYTFSRPYVEEPIPPFIFYLMFFVGIALFGILTPLVLLIFSVIMLIRKKTLHPVRYAALTVLSICWILLTIFVVVLMLI